MIHIKVYVSLPFSAGLQFNSYVNISSGILFKSVQYLYV